MIDTTVETLVHTCNSLACVAETKLGYDHAELNYVYLYPNGEISVYLTVSDTFQEDIHYDCRSHCPNINLRGESLDELWAGLNRIPSRKSRELETIIRIMEPLGKNVDHLRNELLKETVLSLIKGIHEVKERLLEVRESE